MQETQLNGETLDIVSENVSKLKELFPEIVTEDKIDFDKLKEVLGKYTEDDGARYNFTWNGKSAALRLAQTPSTGTLRPCKDESKNWDTTENLYIEGDNLEVLKLLQKSYYGKIKMIYIDPPYNTGKDFVYKDNYKDNLQNYLELTNQIDNEGNKTSTNSDTHGRYHTNWLNMMYPRLRLARNLLNDEGVIFISIDDNEVENLKKMCNEIFGEENFAAQIIWQKVYSPRMDVQGFSNSHDYILCYVKSNINAIKREEFEQNKKQFNLHDDTKNKFYRRRSIRKEGSNSLRTDAPGAYFPLISPDGTEVYPIKPDGTESCWRWNKSTYESNLKEGNVEWIYKDNCWQVYAKQYLNETSTKPPETLWFHEEVNHNHGAAEDLKKVLNAKVFDSPKPKELLIKMMKISTNLNSIILDFFSGSGTTAHSVMQFNSEDGGNRKFILVQLPETTNEKDEAHKTGYTNICEIGKERIRRAGDKIVSELQNDGQTSLDGKKASDLDIGFKVFKLDSSNLQKWDPDYENLEQTLLDSVENLVPGRSELDLVYEVMLKYGIDLTLPVEEFTVQDKKVYSIGFGALLICLEDKITADMASEIIKLKEDLAPEVMRVVFKDNGFLSDSDKTNFKETLKTNGIEEFVTI